jgi:homocysteine S-methyltransferase
MSNLTEYQEKLNRPLVLDGALGSLLQQSKNKLDKYIWSSILNLTDPKTVINLHKKYIEAGAEIITTNTFRTNPIAVKLSNFNISIAKFVKNSVKLSKIAIEKNDIFIAGSNAPAEDCYQKERNISFNDLEFNHKKHIELLFESNVDFILNETQSHFDEIKLICNFCYNNKIPYVISLYSESGETILSGEPLSEVYDFIINFSPLAISINCVSKSIFEKIDNTLLKKYKNGFYLNMGNENREGDFNNLISPEEYKHLVKKYINNSTFFIGACCGSNPNHINKIRELVNEIN